MASNGSAGGIKQFVLDTNVLLHNPNALFVFQDNNVIIPFAVIEELDKLKRQEDDIGRNAREVIRRLDRLRARGPLTDGVNWGEASPQAGAAASTASNGATGSIRIAISDDERPHAIADDTKDNRIIAVAWELHVKGERSVFVSKDLNARIKSDALGIPTEDFQNQKIDAERLYTGYVTTAVEGRLIDQLYDERMLPLEPIHEALAAEHDEDDPTLPAEPEKVLPNAFVLLKDVEDENHTGLARRLADTEHLIPISPPRKPIFGLLARNVQQTMALDLLMDDEIQMITLLGSAGTGKTLLALASGMAKVFQEGRFDKLLVARPIMPDRKSVV